ncbi:MAG: hypothetical protein AAFX99_16105, partial [Myxococcota bacterium]
MKRMGLGIGVVAAWMLVVGCGGDDGGTDGATATSNGATTGSTTGNGTADTSNGTTTTDGTTGGTTGATTMPPQPPPEGCNPLAEELDCALPYPSDYFTVDDPQMPSGRRVLLPEPAQLVNANRGGRLDFLRDNPVDGFSMNAPMMAFFGEEVDMTNVIFHTDDPAPTLLPTSTTVILNADTGEPVPHWAELDKFTDDPTQQAFIIRPLLKLEPQTRYVVAIQGLMGTDGEPIPAPAGFAALRDGEPVDEGTALAWLGSRYEAELFPVLASFGVTREDLVLAWDFTTGSEEWLTRDLRTIREDGMARLEATPPVVTVTNLIEDHNDSIALRLEGTLRVPLYLTSAGTDGVVNRDDNGLPAYNGEAEVPFLIQVPYSAMPQADVPFDPALIVVYGHGFFGLKEEINYGSFMRSYSDERRYVTAAVDWWGMAEDDVAQIIARLTTDFSAVFNFAQRLPQAMLNFVALQMAIQTTLADLDQLKSDDQLLYDPDQMVYYGISQGHIYGVTMLTMSPYIDRAVLGVGGGSYSLMMTRANAFRDLFGIVGAYLEGPVQVQKMLMFSQHVWDRTDPMTYAEH